MSSSSKMKSTKNHKKEDGTFHTKHIKHDPQAESARAVFGMKDNKPYDTDKNIND
ncbi:MAG TPA: CPC_1213 family protein [Mobilitalea sp.]|nr:CPC_1213 family protein [Mobilitalea sp.]